MTNPVYFLALESSCDETAAAVFTDDRRILSNVVASQTELHARFGGVVPEIASRAHLRNLLPVIDESLRQANIRLEQIGCVVVHNMPGLVGSLMMGVSAAKILSLALNVPLIAVNHILGHIYACQIPDPRPMYPCIGFVVSGGHTALFHCQDPLTFQFLGGTRDDAAGEAFDKVAAILGLGFPGGPNLEKEAQKGDPNAYQFPRTFLKEDRLEFSFSGIKTAVLYTAQGQDAKMSEKIGPGATRANIAASFQQAVVEVLVSKAIQAVKKFAVNRLAVGGGVIANQAFRQLLTQECNRYGIELFIPPRDLCTDNAAMAALAIEKYKQGDFANLSLDAEANFI